ncbi:hypothetical protein [Ralstonia pickettii]|nr:hypothetical protein [Ralstonia pickettii]
MAISLISTPFIGWRVENFSGLANKSWEASLSGFCLKEYDFFRKNK